MRWNPGRLLALLACTLALAAGRTAQADANLARELLQRHAELAPALKRSEFGRPLLLESRDASNRAEGVVFTVLDASMAQVQALAQPQRWCDVLMLHQTTRRCQVSAGDKDIQVEVGNKPGLFSEGLALRLNFDTEHRGPDLLSVRLNADRGPLGSRDYEISLQAVPLPSGQSFLQFRYSYGFGLAARLAMQSYLNTWGRQKIGFSSVPGPHGQGVQPVTGMRGVIERNTMRYFLGIEAVLQTLELPPTQLDKRLQSWFDATERYPRQLHELERADYLALKRRQLGLES